MADPRGGHGASSAQPMKRDTAQSRSENPPPHHTVGSVALLTHGSEDVALGGPSVRVPRTKRELEKLNIKIIASSQMHVDVENVDIIHGFNIWPPLDAFNLAHQAKLISKPFIFSPIILDLSEREFWETEILKTYRVGRSNGSIESELKKSYVKFSAEKHLGDFEPGYRAALKAIEQISAGIVFLSEFERALFKSIVDYEPKQSWLIQNPVDAAQFSDGNESLFKKKYGLTDYVLCVGRIEHRKNQLMLATALAATDLPLVLVGHEVDKEYSALLRQFGGPRLHIMGRIAPGSELLRSAISGARVFALPSWAEGAPLAALEAGAAGTPLVLSNRSGEREYFGDFALYCDPSSPRSIREAIVQAWDCASNHRERTNLRTMIAENFSWSQHARKTLAAYEVAIRSQSLISPIEGEKAICTGIVLDLTPLIATGSSPLELTQIQINLSKALLKLSNVDVSFIAYSESKEFIQIPDNVIKNSSIFSYMDLQKRMPASTSRIKIESNFSDVVTFFGEWAQDEVYFGILSNFARANSMRLNVLVRDLDPYIRPYWYPKGIASLWKICARTMISRAHRVIVCSNDVAYAVREFCVDENIECPAISQVYLANEQNHRAKDVPRDYSTNIEMILRDVSFVLTVGDIHPRENYFMILDVWRMLIVRMKENVPHLAIVVNASYPNSEFYRAVNEDKYLRKFIHIFENVASSDLDWLYTSCLLTIKPSLSGGWDASVGRSLAHQKISLVSNPALVPEHACNVMSPLSELDPVSWADELFRYVTSPEERQRAEDAIREFFRCTSWVETVDNLLSALSGPFKTPSVELYVPGAIIACSVGPGSRYLSAGWHPPEEWGVWASDNCAIIRLRLAVPVPDDLILTLLARSFKRPEMVCRYRILANGEDCGTITFLDVAQPSRIDHALCRIMVPRHLFNNTTEIEFCIVGESSTHVRAVLPGTVDDRELSFGLSAFVLESAHIQSDSAALFGGRSDVRKILTIENEEDLCQLISECPVHPLILANRWCQNLQKFVRYGAALGETIASVGGMVGFSLGLGRISISSALRLQLWAEASEECTTEIAVAICVNGQTIGSPVNLVGLTMIDVEIASDVYRRSDPLEIILFNAAEPSEGSSDFFVRGLRISTADAQSAFDLPLGETVHLPINELEYEPDISTFSLPLTATIRPADVDQNSVIVVRGADGMRLELSSESVTATAVADLDGNMLLPLENGREQILRLVKETQAVGPVDSLCLSDDSRRAMLCNLQHVRLLPIGRDDLDADPFLYASGWHSVEDDGRCWGASDRVNFWIRPAGASVIILTGEIMSPIDKAPDLIVLANNIPTVIEQIDFDNDLNHVIIRFFLTVPVLPIVLISLIGVPAARPIDLGLGDDERTLSISLVALEGVETRRS